jgi:valyl-tRNA synthetase
VNLSLERLTANKGLTNKLWNAGKFIHQNIYTIDGASNDGLSDLKVQNKILP